MTKDTPCYIFICSVRSEPDKRPETKHGKSSVLFLIWGIKALTALRARQKAGGRRQEGRFLAYRREAPHCTVGQCRDDRRVKKKGSMPSF